MSTLGEVTDACSNLAKSLLVVFLTCMNNVSLCNDPCWANLPVWHKNSSIAIFSDTMNPLNAINVKLCMMVLLTELYSSPLSVTLTTFQGYSIVPDYAHLCVNET